MPASFPLVSSLCPCSIPFPQIFEKNLILATISPLFFIIQLCFSSPQIAENLKKEMKIKKGQKNQFMWQELLFSLTITLRNPSNLHQVHRSLPFDHAFSPHRSLKKEIKRFYSQNLKKPLRSPLSVLLPTYLWKNEDLFFFFIFPWFFLYFFHPQSLNRREAWENNLLFNFSFIFS